MEIRKPIPAERVHVVVRNPRTGKSKTITFYNTDEVRCATEIRRVMQGVAVGVQSPSEDESDGKP